MIDQETQREINAIKHRRFVSWYDWNQDKRGNSYKSRLQFDIDRMIRQSVNWSDFLNKMKGLGYEIKEGKYIAFWGKSQQRFTRAKMIGENYTEERMKNRILNKDKEIDVIVDEKAKGGKGYEQWTKIHNIKTAAATLMAMQKRGFQSMEDMEREILKCKSGMNALRTEFDKYAFEQKRIKAIAGSLQICISKRAYYEGYKKNPNGKIYMMMNRKDVEAYKAAYAEVEIFMKQFPNLKKEIIQGLKAGSGKELFHCLNERSKYLQTEQRRLAQEHNSMQGRYEELVKLKRNIDKYLGREETKTSVRARMQVDLEKSSKHHKKKIKKEVKR